MASALEEFGSQGYGLSSINTICKNGNISKGNLYHHFQDKDELYLACVSECFTSLTAYLKEQLTFTNPDVQTNLEDYFKARLSFFEQNPLYLQLFSEGAISPPAHLAQQIRSAREAFDHYNVTALTSLLQSVTLQPGITLEEVVEIFRLYQDFVNTRFQMTPTGPETMKHHEDVCKRSISILLYGVAQGGAKNE